VERVADAGLSPYLVAQIAFGFALGVLLFWLAAFLDRERGPSRFATASHMFTRWWRGLGAGWLLWAADTLLVHSVGPGRAWALLDYLLVMGYILVILMAFASLFYYLLFLYVGSERLAWVAWGLYGAITVGILVVMLLARPPTALDAATGLYAPALWGDYTSVVQLLQAALLVPVIVASVALFTLVARVSDPLRRYRVLLLSSSLTIYLVMPLLFGSNPGVEPTDAAQWAREILNKAGLLVAVGAAVLAYRPPQWVAKRYGFQAEAS
jgi:hypothetical protein